MKSEIEQLIQNTSKEQLIQLVEELCARHPLLLAEITSILANAVDGTGVTEDTEEEISKDWDFSGEEPVTLHTVPFQPVPFNSAAHQQRIEEYMALLQQKQSAQALLKCLGNLIEEAIINIQQNNYHGALDLFALLIDERLLARYPDTTVTYDEMIDAAMYSLEALLSETSSNAMFNTETVTLSPLLTIEVRHRWLERLFTLWLKRLEARRAEEELTEIILDVAWKEDMQLLRALAQNELQKHTHNEHGNIVDFTRQFHTRALEKFLKVLPHS